ncbi:hypothetical protein BDP27DRAFT_582903 [Rhodocollybia butyracea]|uniref:Uncharacterized protein n=1 Tax=Rhodocollybia butyracea TaxID=206335 RepID=A0A9P5PVG8_9AGAR|nr:hypothetical protein BDP27DRAFT_582903 [Rhodocollybia butyracea]
MVDSGCDLERIQSLNRNLNHRSVESQKRVSRLDAIPCPLPSLLLVQAYISARRPTLPSRDYISLRLSTSFPTLFITVYRLSASLYFPLKPPFVLHAFSLTNPGLAGYNNVIIAFFDFFETVQHPSSRLAGPLTAHSPESRPQPVTNPLPDRHAEEAIDNRKRVILATGKTSRVIGVGDLKV